MWLPPPSCSNMEMAMRVLACCVRVSMRTWHICVAAPSNSRRPPAQARETSPVRVPCVLGALHQQNIYRLPDRRPRHPAHCTHKPRAVQSQGEPTPPQQQKQSRWQSVAVAPAAASERCTVYSYVIGIMYVRLLQAQHPPKGEVMNDIGQNAGKNAEMQECRSAPTNHSASGQ